MFRLPYSLGDFDLDLNEALISVSKNHNNKIVHALSNSCSALLLCGILVLVAVGAFAVIASIMADIVSLGDPAYVEYKRYCESDIPRNLLLNPAMEYNCSNHVRPKGLTDKQLGIIEIIVGSAAFLGFLILGFLICQHWAKSIKNAIVITPDSINDLLDSVASPGGLISEEKNMTISSGSQLLSIQIDHPISGSHNTSISSWSS